MFWPLRLGSIILIGTLIGAGIGGSASQVEVPAEPLAPGPIQSADFQESPADPDGAGSSDSAPQAIAGESASNRVEDPTAIPPEKSQDPDRPTNGTATESFVAQDAGSDSGLPGRVRPDIFLLPDKEGRLQSVLGFQYEDFLNAWQIKEGISETDQEPLFNLTTLEMKGKLVRSDVAELSVRCEILPLKTGLIPVPLRMSNAILLEVQKTSPSDTLIFDRQQGGLVVWIDGVTGRSNSLQLHVLVKLKQTGNKTQLQLPLPNAEVSLLSLDIPSRQVEAQTNRGLIEQIALPDQTTRIVVRGPAGLLELVWATSAKPTQRRASLLQATGAILSLIDDHGIVTEAHLTIQSFGGPFDHCRIRLPPGAQLRTAGEGDLTWEEISAGELDSSGGRRRESPSGPIYEFKFDQPQTGSVQLNLVTHQSIQTERSSSTGNPSFEASFGSAVTELGGFEVLGALRQFGFIAVRLDENLRLDWEANNSIRQTTSLPKQLQRDDLVAAFEYVRQPWSLPVRILPRPSRVRIQADHLLMVKRDHLLWQGKFKLNVQNVALFALRMNIDGWSIEPDGIGPRTVVDADRFVDGHDGMIEVPLRQPIEGDVTVTVTARRDLIEGTDRLTAPIPSLLQASVIGETLTVVTPANITLKPDLGASRGLAPMEHPIHVDLPVPLWSPRFLAYRCFLHNPEFVAHMEHHEQTIHSESNTKITLHRNRTEVEETLTWYVQYAPINQVSLAIPKDPEIIRTLEAWYQEQPISIPLPVSGEDPVIEKSGKEVVIRSPETATTGLDLEGEDPADGNEVPAFAATDGDPHRENAETIRSDIGLPRDTMGRVTMVFRYTLNRSLLLKIKPGDPPSDFPIMLILPEDIAVDRNTATVCIAPESALNVALSPENESWESMDFYSPDRNEAPLETVLSVKATDPVNRLPLSVAIRPFFESTAATVNRMWIQTFLGDTSYRTRCLFNIQTKRPSIILGLSRKDEVSIETVLVNGRSALYEWDAEHQLKILLSSSLADIHPENKTQPESAYCIEIQLHRPGAFHNLQRIHLEPPLLAEGIVPQRIYWQVMTPSHFHLLNVPDRWNREYIWCWQGVVARRESVIDTQALARWIHNDTNPIFLTGANEYLFSTFGQPTPLTLYMGSRSLIVLLSSGLSLGVGLILLYFPKTRQSYLLWIGATLIAAALLIWTDPTMMIVQSAILGFLLGLIALILRRLLSTSRKLVGHPAPSGSSAMRLASGDRDQVDVHGSSGPRQSETEAPSKQSGPPRIPAPSATTGTPPVSAPSTDSESFQ